MSSQLVTMPCSMGYFRVRIPLLLWASSPTYESFWPMPIMTPWCRGTPDDGWEHGPGGVVASKASFAHAGAIVNDERGDFFFHGDQRMPGRWSGGKTGSTNRRQSVSCSENFYLVS